MSPQDRGVANRLRPKWSVNTLFFLTLTVGLGTGWWLDHHQSRRELHALHEKILTDGIYTVRLLVEAASASDNEFERQELIEAAELTLSVLDPPAFDPSKRFGSRAYAELHNDILMAKRNFERDRRLLDALSAMEQANAVGDRKKSIEIKAKLLREYPNVIRDERFNEF